MNFIHYFFEYPPEENGFLTFVLGILTAITFYHFVLFFQQKNISYIYYATYTFVLLLAYFVYSKNDFIANIPYCIKHFFKLTHHFWVWLYNIIYFSFILHFLNFKKYFPKQRKIMLYTLGVLFFIGLFGLVYSIFYQDSQLLNKLYSTIFTNCIIIISLWGFYLAFKAKEITKYYILTGCFLLFTASIFTILVIDFSLITDKTHIAYTVFYMAIILENLCFSLALGLKQKLIYIEKNNTQKQLILKLEENKKLKEERNSELNQRIKSLNQEIKLKEKIENLKLTALKSQINPHFIFNALNSIKLYIVKNNVEKASKYLNEFSKLIRKVLEVSNQDYISLEEELSLIKLYVSIENTRFKTPINFNITNTTNTNNKHIKIPSLILQPFVENSIWHGLSLKDDPKKIDIEITETHQYINITITDNGIGRERSLENQKNRTFKNKSFGIDITKKKLELLSKQSNKEINIQLTDLKENNQPSGTKVMIKIKM